MNLLVQGYNVTSISLCSKPDDDYIDVFESTTGQGGTLSWKVLRGLYQTRNRDNPVIEALHRQELSAMTPNQILVLAAVGEAIGKIQDHLQGGTEREKKASIPHAAREAGFNESEYATIMKIWVGLSLAENISKENQ